jgi:hypothetical protein
MLYSPSASPLDENEIGSDKKRHLEEKEKKVYKKRKEPMLCTENALDMSIETTEVPKPPTNIIAYPQVIKKKTSVAIQPITEKPIGEFKFSNVLNKYFEKAEIMELMECPICRKLCRDQSGFGEYIDDFIENIIDIPIPVDDMQLSKDFIEFFGIEQINTLVDFYYDMAYNFCIFPDVIYCAVWIFYATFKMFIQEFGDRSLIDAYKFMCFNLAW